MPHFILNTGNQIRRVACAVVPDMVMQGWSWLPGVVCLDAPDAFLAECLAYHVNEGAGYQSPASGTIDLAAPEWEDFPDAVSCHWQYVPDTEEQP